MSVLFFCLCMLGDGVFRVGQTFPDWVLPDQHGHLHQVRQDTAWILMTFDKRTGVLARRWLREKPEDYLANKQIALIADISQMPPSIGARKVMPKIKAYARRVLLSDDEAHHRILPRQPGCITILAISPQGRINHIFYPDSEADLEAIFAH